MVKFMVVLYRRPDLSESEFQAYLRDVHGPMAEAIPNLLYYTQNFVAHDLTREHPGWDAIVELFWADRTIMEAAWASPEGKAATADLAEFADLARTTWSMVDSLRRR
ncbi:MAG TPA: EthD family reductase [Thermoanaerobaculia bacterium]|jgi:uncharacterized protein (TIGR02118 family)|nr:EthD family reductase [Thermoanaerobaculia bacterium]